MNVNFEDAERKQSKASIVIQGLSGSGKTGLALMLARCLTDDWSTVYCLDSENRSMDLFEGITLSNGEKCTKFKKFDLTEDDGYAPSNYIDVRDAAVKAGATVFIQDSTTQAWSGKGGVLDLVASVDSSNTKNISSWNDPTVVVEKQILGSRMWRDTRCHMISTVRMKEKIGFTEDNKVIKVGEQPIMQDQVKYEPDLIIHMVKAGTPDGDAPIGTIEKSRYAILRVGETYSFTEDLCKQIKEYLDEGAAPEVLLERQKNNMVTSVSDLLSKDKTKVIPFKMFKKNHGYADDAKLTDMNLEDLNKLYKLLFN